MAGRAPTFVVAGAGRAGTTGLVEGLRAHPDVFVTSPKEPHYLALHGTRPDFRGPGDQESINRTAVTSAQDYADLFPQHSDGLALGEGSVSTLYYYQRALPELLRINPEVRVIVLLREPVARAWSSFHYLRAQGREPESDFLTAVEAEASRRADNWHHLWHYTAMSTYADAIAALQEHLLPGHLGVWFHDDLERDYATTFGEVLRFLELSVPPGLGDDVPRVNVSGTPRYRLLQEAMWRVQGQATLRRAARLATTWRFREAMKARMVRRDTVPADSSRTLAPLFTDDLVRLGDLLAPSTRLPGWVTGAGNPQSR